MNEILDNIDINVGEITIEEALNISKNIIHVFRGNFNLQMHYCIIILA